MSSLSTFRFDEKLTATIDQLKNSTSATSKAEIVRRAVALYKVVHEAQEHGQNLVLIDNDKTQTRIVLP